MNEYRRTRPPLATITCVYLIVTAFIPLPIIWIGLFGRLDSAYMIYRSSLPHSSMPWLICTLTIAGVVALWQMRRAAFFLLAIRYALAIALQVHHLRRSIALFYRLSAIWPRAFADSLEMKGLYAFMAAEWPLAVLILWYVYRITSPQHFSAESAGPELSV